MVQYGQRGLAALISIWVLGIGAFSLESTAQPAEPSRFQSAALDRAAERERLFADWLGGQQGVVTDRNRILLAEVVARQNEGLGDEAAKAYRSALTQDVAPFRSSLNRYQQRYASLVDSLSNGDLTIDGFNRQATTVEAQVSADLEVWAGKIELVRRRLRESSTNRQDARMFGRAYDLAANFYNEGNYTTARALIRDLLATYRGIAPTQLLHFYIAECSYGLLEWKEAQRLYRQTIDAGVPRDATSGLRAIVGDALLNWTELAFAEGQYLEIDRLWRTNPQLPPDQTDASRVKLLTAEACLNLSKPAQAKRVLGQISKELVVDASSPDYDPYKAQQTQQKLSILSAYGRLLEAEAEIGVGGTAVAKSHESPEPISADMGSDTDFDLDQELDLEAPDDSSAVASTDSLGADGADSLAAPAPGSEAALLTELAELGDLSATTTEDADDLALDMGDLGAEMGDLRAEARRLGGTNIYDVATSNALKRTRDLTYPALDAGIRVLIVLRDSIASGDFGESRGPLLDRVNIAIGHANYQRGTFEDAEKAYSKVSSRSAHFTVAQLGRAWSFTERRDFNRALLVVDDLQYYNLPPNQSLETAVLRAHLLQKVAQDSAAAAQVAAVHAWSTVDKRRAVARIIRQQIVALRNDLQTVAVLALDQQKEQLYLKAITEQEELAALIDTAGSLELKTRRPTSTENDPPEDDLVAQIRQETSRWEALRREVSTLRRQIRPASGNSYDTQRDLRQRYVDLQSWLNRIDPRMKDDTLNEWLRYASFAYAKQPFEENQRRKLEAARLKSERSRIDAMLSKKR